MHVLLNRTYRKELSSGLNLGDSQIVRLTHFELHCVLRKALPDKNKSEMKTLKELFTHFITPIN